MFRRKIICAIFALFLLPIAPIFSANKGDAGSIAVDFLRLGVGAAPAAQGEAYAGRGGVIDALRYNPAGLATLQATEVQMQHNDYFLDIKSEYFAIAHNVNDWVISGSFFNLDEGDFTRRTYSNPDKNGTFDAGSQVYSLGFAHHLTGGWSAGLSGRFFQEEIDNAKRDGFAVDLGLYLTPETGWYEFGVACRNVGSSTSFDLDKEKLPFETAIGLSFPKLFERIRLSTEVTLPRNQETEVKAGLEVPFGQYVCMRAGYDSRNDLDKGWSAGIGFKYNSVKLDYAYVPFEYAGDAHRVSLNYSFGK